MGCGASAGPQAKYSSAVREVTVENPSAKSSTLQVPKIASSANSDHLTVQDLDVQDTAEIMSTISSSQSQLCEYLKSIEEGEQDECDDVSHADKTPHKRASVYQGLGANWNSHGKNSIETITTVSTMSSDASDESVMEWEGVQEVVLRYSTNINSTSPDTDSEDTALPDAHQESASEHDCPEGHVHGPVLNRVAAYGLTLGWIHKHRGPLRLARRSLFDFRRLFDVVGHALQFAELNELVATAYDDNVKLHRQLAFTLYRKFLRLSDSKTRPYSIPRRGRHWEDMGFQREDFATDLRGVGILGLLHLLSFFGSYPDTARIAFATNREREAQHGINGSVPMACASLNFSSLAILALREGHLSGLCLRHKSVHSVVLKIHAALMSLFVYKFQSNPSATVLNFSEIMAELNAVVRKAPSKLLKDFRDKVPPSEKKTAENFVVIRSMTDDDAEACRPSAFSDDSEVLARVRKSVQSAAKLDRSFPLSRACTFSPASEIEEVFRLVCRGSPDDAPLASLQASAADLSFFLCDTLGYGRDEILSFRRWIDASNDGPVQFAEFQRGYRLLNSHRISKRAHEVFMRKPGSIQSQQFVMNNLQGCEVRVLDNISSCTIDGCHACNIVVGPCESSIFVRDCEGSTFYVIAQQVRIRECVNCTFFTFSATEPVIESSSTLKFAPISLAYHGLAEQLQTACLDPSRNMWNAVFDFSSPGNNRKHWNPAGISECRPCWIVLDENADEQDLLPAADVNAFPPVTRESLQAPPLKSDMNPGFRVDQVNC